MTTPALPAINWFEIPVADLDRAQTFHEAVLGQPLRREPRGPQTLAVLPHAEPAVGGALIAGAHIAPPSASGTLVYLNVNPALQAALDRALAAGAQLLTPRVDLPDGMGSFVHVLDVQEPVGLEDVGCNLAAAVHFSPAFLSHR